ncbi:Transcriptional regulator, GntR family domain / Aspartate aminotransferase [Candidatus Burkholderia verschuerenii]|uniref:Transcriptional regulator, GntR family domain / Aspartate aminotransferase n=1 Tax=Candidatus Burkholderia verschuerenii TaxID=242163 RepID=A0A0L0MBZ9_9BURK|nr:PLP-dependent aminotransferase family protein [Candidatus Burkholderia verschuerenii]KND60232.1 Transcriptional regulator, GntR family domain / Aspartate aminotransferase [Candidatus Burkholderia verschuerenii]
MIEFKLERGSRQSPTLVEQLVQAFSSAIEEQTLRAGVLLPSVQRLAESHALSTFTVTEAYGRLVSMGLVTARRGSGYRVAVRGHGERARAVGSVDWQPPSLTATWLLSDVFADHSVPIKSGCGTLPNEWVNETGLQHALRAVGRVPAARIADYGHPYGFAPLRERIAEQLDRHGLPVDAASNVLLTAGATQGLDLIVRTLLRAGDAVIVEDPGYCNLLQILRLAGLQVHGVPRTVAGIDTDVFERLAIEHRPKAVFLNTTLQNPTGATFSMAAAFRLMQIAERHGLWVVEDDVNRELAPAGAPLLAAMEGLNRVLYVGGFAKTITPALRCGYVVAERDVLRELARTKMAVGLTSSEATERIVEKVLTEGRYARHVEVVVERLKDAHALVEERMDALDIDLFRRPRAGLFVWGTLPIDPADASDVATRALEHGIWLAPGSYFRPDDAPSAAFRFNVPYSLDDALWEFLRRQAIRA